MAKPIKPRATTPAPDFPAWQRVEPPVDRSRRRFLKQVTVATGGATFLSGLGLPRLGHGQSAPADFSVLDGHPASHELAADPSALPSPPPMAAPPASPASPAPPAQPPAPGRSAEWVTEDWALWIDPGYLVLIRWSRQSEDMTPVGAMEGSTEAVGGYLQANITSGQTELHDLVRLHEHEAAILALLAPRVSPAVIEVLHLDHDCRAICGPPEVDPENIPLPGVPPPATWE